MHIEKLANEAGSRLVVGRNGQLVIIYLATYGAVSMGQDAVAATKNLIARRKAAKLAETQTPAPTA